MLGLPDGVSACLFDMDGVVTQTAVVHAAAWKEMFDDFLRARAESTGTEFVPFDAHAEYDAYVDGKLARHGADIVVKDLAELLDKDAR
jgi:beta-phosphoglucomutase-like phosphatase (HAD superfamily)